MVASVLLLLASCAAIAWVVRFIYLGITGAMAEEGRELPFSFAFGKITYPAGDDFVVGLNASRWAVPDPSIPPGGGQAPVTAPVTRVGYKFGKHEYWLGPGRIEHRIDGRAKVDRGKLAITRQRVLYAGASGRVELPLRDIANMSVRGPLLEFERRSARGQAVAFRVPQPVLVAKIVQALASRPAAR